MKNNAERQVRDLMIMVCLPYLHDDPAGVVAVDSDVKENSGVSHDRRAVGSRVLRTEGGAAPMQSGSESLFSIRVSVYMTRASGDVRARREPITSGGPR